MVESIVLGSIAMSGNVWLYVLAAIKPSLFKFNMCNIYKNNIAKMFVFIFSNFKILDLIELFLFLVTIF